MPCWRRREENCGRNKRNFRGTGTTIKFLNFGTPENFAKIYLKFKQRGQKLRVFCQNGANGIANSEDPDQTAPVGALFAQTYLSKNVGSLRYTSLIVRI